MIGSHEKRRSQSSARSARRPGSHGTSEPEKLVCALRFYAADNSLPDDLTAQIEAVADAIEERETDIAMAVHEKWVESGGGRY